MVKYYTEPLVQHLTIQKLPNSPLKNKPNCSNPPPINGNSLQIVFHNAPASEFGTESPEKQANNHSFGCLRRPEWLSASYPVL
ncbi:unnamed protein product [Cuscuta campestris]|uniref:Uncharacterized protein n=1 Tax=Cuscuta campestris TaxID=132261 RepID=A0A484ND43_9ASTE|nr:unnamed protein product [Cuscuta campestris]